MKSQPTEAACEATVEQKSSVDVQLIPTFHSLGIYWKQPRFKADDSAYARFKKLSSKGDYRRSLDFVYAARNHEFRGSLVHLDSGTAYALELVLNGKTETTALVNTWCETFPIARIEKVSLETPQSQPLRIRNVHGTPEGYVLFTPGKNGIEELNGINVEQNIIIENSSYIIVRGFLLKNAKENAILIKGGKAASHIVIEQNTIENWGSVNTKNGFGNASPAIKTANGKGKNYGQLVIQRNTIRNPRGRTNSWSEYRADVEGCAPSRCHPRGPSGLHLNQTSGNHVIRYNDIYSTNGNYLNDGIGGAKNFTRIGFPNRDSDIYGNLIQNVWDDAIESEGGNKNVRIWGNYIDQAYVALAVSPVAEGPIYLFRNIVYRTQRAVEDTMTSGVFVKAQTRPELGTGAIYFFHNTAFRSNTDTGIRLGISGSGGRLINFHSRNNIIDASSKAFVSSGRSDLDAFDFDFDLFSGKVIEGESLQANGIKGRPLYQSDCPLHSAALAQGSPGIGIGTEIPNFSDNLAVRPDMGAQQSGAPTLEFGRTAYTGQLTNHGCS